MCPIVMSYSRKPPGKIQKTGFTTEERRPHGRNLSTRRALTAGRFPFEIGSAGLHGANRAPSSPRARLLSSPRPRDRELFAYSSCAPGGITTVTVPLHGVPAERRQESCQFRHMAPRGRLASVHSG